MIAHPRVAPPADPPETSLCELGLIAAMALIASHELSRHPLRRVLLAENPEDALRLLDQRRAEMDPLRSASSSMVRRIIEMIDDLGTADGESQPIVP